MTALTFVGMGAIGRPMARVLVEAGHDVIGVDPSEAAREIAADAGILVRSHITEANTAEIVVVMVATGDQLDTLIEQAGEGAAGQTWIVMSTIGPDAVRSAAHRLTTVGAYVVDAPVTGGVARAQTAELVIFAAGADGDVERVLPVLQALGTPRIVGRRIGDGQAIKVVNQHLCSVHIVAAAEALHLAATLGLDPTAVLDLVKDGAAGSWMLADRGPRMLMGTDAPVTSTIGIFVKDSGLVAEAATGSGAPTPLLDVARAHYLEAVELGLAMRDDSRVIETYQRVAQSHSAGSEL